MTKRPHGQIRRSQLVGTFGPGAMADLPNHSVLIAGLDHWSKGGDEVMEPRLVTKLQDLLQVSNLKLMLPPPDQEDPTAPPTGVTAWQFPEWFITQYVELADRGSSRSRMLIHRTALSRGKYIDDNKKRQPVVPIRFVQACRRGHISDISWKTYVHRGRSDCTRNLWIDERGTSGDISEVWVRCECGQERPVGEAAYGNGHPLGQCDGHRPWLGPYTREDCTEPNRLLIRNASNAYFPQQMSVISLPDRDEAVAKAVDQVWEHYLKFAEDLEELKYERKKKEPVSAALEGFANDVVFAEIQKRRGGTAAPLKSVKLAEFETLSTATDEIGEDRPGGDFFARTLPQSKWDKPWMVGVERIVLVHRLREVVALAGFTRFEPSSPNVEGELDLAVEPARLAREPSWLPAIENKGEGIFIQLKTAAVDAWLARPQVQERGRHLLTGFGAWATEHAGSKRKFFGLPYVMLQPHRQRSGPTAKSGSEHCLAVPQFFLFGVKRLVSLLQIRSILGVQVLQPDQGLLIPVHMGLDVPDVHVRPNIPARLPHVGHALSDAVGMVLGPPAVVAQPEQARAAVGRLASGDAKAFFGVARKSVGCSSGHG